VAGWVGEDPEAFTAGAQPAGAQRQCPRPAGVEVVDEEVEVGLLRVRRNRPAGLVVVADPLEHQALAITGDKRTLRAVVGDVHTGEVRVEARSYVRASATRISR
jgi:hypothetical protein